MSYCSKSSNVITPNVAFVNTQQPAKCTYTVRYLRAGCAYSNADPSKENKSLTRWMDEVQASPFIRISCGRT